MSTLPCSKSPSAWIHRQWLTPLALSLTYQHHTLHFYAALLRWNQMHGLTVSDSTGSGSLIYGHSSPARPHCPADGSPSTWFQHWWFHWLPSLSDKAALHIHNALLKGALAHGFTAGDSTGSLSFSVSLSLTDIAALHVHAALLKGALVHGFTTGDSTGSLLFTNIAALHVHTALSEGSPGA